MTLSNYKLLCNVSGNATAIPIISMIGLGMGVLLWGVTNCVCGWASSRYGLFGLKKEVPNNVLLNYIGLGLVILGFVLKKVFPKF